MQDGILVGLDDDEIIRWNVVGIIDVYFREGRRSHVLTTLSMFFSFERSVKQKGSRVYNYRPIRLSVVGCVREDARREEVLQWQMRVRNFTQEHLL